jgi:DNA polymerase I-like protein with 3'-5' exonuclease and polymerase domains
LWEYGKELKTAAGIPILKHLKKKGFPNLDKYATHVETVEDYFWNEMFRDYGKWRERWYNDYLRKGYVDCLSGFRFTGFMKRNESINYPVQGVAFHCLLWSLIRLNKYFKKHKMKSCIIGQIHDSIIINVAQGELDDVLAIAQKIMCVSIRKHWPWIITQLEIEAEVGEPGESWWKMKEVKLAS